VFILTSLQLNVQTPSNATDSLPVFVWIHGGEQILWYTMFNCDSKADSGQAATAKATADKI